MFYNLNFKYTLWYNVFVEFKHIYSKSEQYSGGLFEGILQGYIYI